MSVHPKVLIIASVQACKGGGFAPQICVNAYRVRCSFPLNGYSRAVAEDLARIAAREEGARYIGDWDVRIEENFKS
jgi:hypothetical protein